MRRKATRVSAGEMDLLSMLWSEGPLTLREAYERFPDFGAPVEYPTIQTRLNRMVEKGLVERSADRPARYRAVATREQVTSGHLRQIIENLTQGDVVPLVAKLLSDQTLSQSQIAELQELLATAKKRSAKASKKRRRS